MITLNGLRVKYEDVKDVWETITEGTIIEAYGCEYLVTKIYDSKDPGCLGYRNWICDRLMHFHYPPREYEEQEGYGPPQLKFCKIIEPFYFREKEITDEIREKLIQLLE